MKNKAKTTFVSVIAMGFVLAVVLFMYYYSPTTQKTEELVASNSTLRTRVEELRVFYEQMEENKQQIADMEKGIKGYLAEFPADVKEEDTIYFAISSMQLDNLRKLYDDKVVPADKQFPSDIFVLTETPKVTYASLSVNAQEELASVDAKKVEDAKIEGLTGPLSFMKRMVTYENITDYPSLKALVQSINCDPDKKVVSKVSYNTNEEGLLSGTITVNFYSVLGTDKPYVEKELGAYLLGLDNLFVTNVAE